MNLTVCVYLSDFLQLRADLDQLLFAVVQPGLEPVVLVQSFCIHLKQKKKEDGGKALKRRFCYI